MEQQHKIGNKIIVFAYQEDFDKLVRILTKRNDPRLSLLVHCTEAACIDDYDQVWNYNYNDPGFNDEIREVGVPNSRVVYIYQPCDIPAVQ